MKRLETVEFMQPNHHSCANRDAQGFGMYTKYIFSENITKGYTPIMKINQQELKKGEDDMNKRIYRSSCDLPGDGGILILKQQNKKW